MEYDGFRKDFKRKTTIPPRLSEETPITHGVHPHIPVIHFKNVPDLEAQDINTERAAWEMLLDSAEMQNAQNRLFYCKNREGVNSKMMCRPLAIDYVVKIRMFMNKWHGESKTYQLGAFLHAGDYRRHWQLRENEREELETLRHEQRLSALQKTEAKRNARMSIYNSDL